MMEAPIEIRELPLALIAPDPAQPRTEFEAEALRALAVSIRQDGLIEPLVVRPVFGRWLLIAGERRWRAALLAGLERVPCVIRNVDADRAFELALIENGLREELTPLEEAAAYRRLMVERAMTAFEVAARVKREPAYVEFRLRLLNLRPEYQDAVRRKILPLPQAADLARLPPEQQPAVFKMYVAGRDANEVARVISALVEAARQPALPMEPEVQWAGDRLERVLRSMAHQLGACYSKRDLELLGWATRGHAECNLQLIGLLIKQLGQLQEALRKAKARRAVRADEAQSA
jgi:ParB family chromosome partitioning protein